MLVPSDRIQQLLDNAGVNIDGPNEWDIKLNDKTLLHSLKSLNSLTLGEAFVHNQWDCDALDELTCRIAKSELYPYLYAHSSPLWRKLTSLLAKRQSVKRSQQDIQFHYDLADPFYKQLLDPLMIYSCAYWQDATTLQDAQVKKLDLICRKLDLKPNMTVLDIGCGWGGLLRYATEHYGVTGLGVALSQAQYQWARKNLNHLPIDFVLSDYRDIPGIQQFDRVVSVGMLEHVGPANYSHYFNIIKERLREDGLALIHTIGNNQTGDTDPWIHKYIFPNGYIPALSQLAVAFEQSGLVLEDLHNIGPHYDPTLIAWWQQIESYWPQEASAQERQQKRIWQFYLLTCAGLFRARALQVWQCFFTHSGHPQPSTTRST
ncbi:cyclopropane fatty acyl phospholipid synthase [Vibrio europaeus]|uniref:cyclopropane fatty acyl phospholipid synthase n=1 Tax=Vibrio europaeus TaxID=300876 RepID=UPI0023423B83|nr:cyclopropane fatty acyl phospholipid synthase [Vibrio europaeus]MDC5848338.1 cyclopropane fatty acyl phospholipid synthase [Vibrio europaeus]